MFFFFVNYMKCKKNKKDAINYFKNNFHRFIIARLPTGLEGKLSKFSSFLRYEPTLLCRAISGFAYPARDYAQFCYCNKLSQFYCDGQVISACLCMSPCSSDYIFSNFLLELGVQSLRIPHKIAGFPADCPFTHLNFSQEKFWRAPPDAFSPTIRSGQRRIHGVSSIQPSFTKAFCNTFGRFIFLLLAFARASMSPQRSDYIIPFQKINFGGLRVQSLRIIEIYIWMIL